MKQFIPFNQINQQEVIVVDGLHPQNLVLSHWKGANIYGNISADTSGEIVLNALLADLQGVNCTKVSATHFDIDGFVGVFALFYPDLAKANREVLIQMAEIGDFRNFDPQAFGSDLALKLCCWINTVEKREFYRPFEEKDEIENCHKKFEFFLESFSDVLVDIDKYQVDWIAEFNMIQKGLKQTTNTEKLDEIGVCVKTISDPMHYYSLFSNTAGYDILVSIYDNNRYELEYKYTTWVDIVGRPTLPRLPLKPLVERLNKLEQKDLKWVFDGITDTGPILRLEKSLLSKADRLANPNEREIYSSSIDPSKFKKEIIQFFESSYATTKKKRFWTWKEMKAFSN